LVGHILYKRKGGRSHTIWVPKYLKLSSF